MNAIVLSTRSMEGPRPFGKKRQFDGEIGIWPIVEHALALRGSKNRPKGSPIIKNISMTRKVYIQMLREKVFPAIREKGLVSALEVLMLRTRC
ncbi:hypothetical protein PI125_g4196 [Phytophthora idaei]|nr:hypothetical protein PI125_g4196 [Phytophthora idaei]KAG3138155.1 hypothetical protein PI126_g17047 [Phytophthora idaei]